MKDTEIEFSPGSIIPWDTFNMWFWLADETAGKSCIHLILTVKNDVREKELNLKCNPTRLGRMGEENKSRRRQVTQDEYRKMIVISAVAKWSLGINTSQENRITNRNMLFWYCYHNCGISRPFEVIISIFYLIIQPGGVTEWIIFLNRIKTWEQWGRWQKII